MTISTIKSRPIYPGLSPDLNARSNLIVCDKAGLEAVTELFSRAGVAFAKRSTIILADEGSVNGKGEALAEDLAPAKAEITPNLATAVSRLRDILASAPMGLRLYAAGSEPLIGSVVQAGGDYAIDHLSIRTEHRGSLRRRVQCVHCKGMIENVTTNPVKCPHCGLNLMVRDHYSRRLAAFQGVCIDAEVPGDVPEAKVVFQ